MGLRKRVESRSLRLAVVGAIAITWGGCGLDKIADDAVGLVKIFVDNPEFDKEIVKFAAKAAVVVAWSIVHRGASPAVEGRNGNHYQVLPIDKNAKNAPVALAIWRLPVDGSAPVPLVEDDSVVALSVDNDKLYWISDDGKGQKRLMTLPIADD